jgi:hypothetical protein
MAPDDEDDGDLYDDEFDFVDEEDDDLSDLDDEDDADEDDADDDSELDRADDRRDVAADSKLDDSKLDDSKLDDEPAPRPAPARRGRGGEVRAAAEDQRDLFEREDVDRERAGRNESDRDDSDRDERNDGRAGADEDAVDEFAPPPTPANFLVHIYEYRQFKRTIDRPFTAEDAEAFASEFNRTSKSYGRFAVAGKDDAKPRKALD